MKNEATYEEWKSKGYIVVKGEKSFTRNPDGVCLFDKSQVTKIAKPYHGTYKVVVSEGAGWRFAHVAKTREKIREDERVLCRCKTLEDAKIVVSGIEDSERNLMW